MGVVSKFDVKTLCILKNLSKTTQQAWKQFWDSLGDCPGCGRHLAGVLCFDTLSNVTWHLECVKIISTFAREHDMHIFWFTKNDWGFETLPKSGWTYLGNPSMNASRLITQPRRLRVVPRRQFKCL